MICGWFITHKIESMNITKFVLFGGAASGKSHIAHALILLSGKDKTALLNSREIPADKFNDTDPAKMEKLRHLVVSKQLLVIEEIPSRDELETIDRFLTGFIGGMGYPMNIVYCMQAHADPIPQPKMYNIECSYNLLRLKYDK